MSGQWTGSGESGGENELSSVRIRLLYDCDEEGPSRARFRFAKRVAKGLESESESGGSSGLEGGCVIDVSTGRKVHFPFPFDKYGIREGGGSS